MLKDYFVKKEKKNTQKGRSKEKLMERDKVLSYRFYYYAHIQCNNYDVTLGILSSEFFISEVVVTTRLRLNQPLLDEIFSHRPTVNELKKQIPFLSW